MHRAVRDLYKRFLWVGRDYPLGLAFVRDKAKAAILNNRHLTSERDILTAVARGRWWVKELIGVVQLRKYRAMRQRYSAGSSGDAAAAASSVAAAWAAEAGAAPTPQPAAPLR